MDYVIEKQNNIPVVFDGDICVLGGSCTGVFAAVRAARLGKKVCIVEKQNMFGGTATAGLVNVWHSIRDFDRKNQIIAGLTTEILDVMMKNKEAVLADDGSDSFFFNPVSMVKRLDELVLYEKIIKTFLHTFYAGAQLENEAVTTVFIQNKDGRGAIKAKYFIDATGDGDLMRDAGCEKYRHDFIQTPTTGFLMKGKPSFPLVKWAIEEHGEEFGLENDWGWFGDVPGVDGISFRADNHIIGYNLEKADDLTNAEIEGRKKAFAFEALLKKYVSPEYSIVNICSTIGIRDTVHYKTKFKANEMDLLTGKEYDDAILKSTYRIDIHHQDDKGITFKDLDGKAVTIIGNYREIKNWNWREDAGITGPCAQYYQVPFAILVQKKIKNIIPAGRMINADEGSYGALRVMVNANQMGEAAGVAASMGIDENKAIFEIDGMKVRKELIKGGSAL